MQEMEIETVTVTVKPAAIAIAISFHREMTSRCPRVCKLRHTHTQHETMAAFNSENETRKLTSDQWLLCLAHVSCYGFLSANNKSVVLLRDAQMFRHSHLEIPAIMLALHSFVALISIFDSVNCVWHFSLQLTDSHSFRAKNFWRCSKREWRCHAFISPEKIHKGREWSDSG